MKKICLIVFVAMVSITCNIWGGEWTQYLGPDRNGISPETGFAKTWPAEGPKVLWTVPLGVGYGAPAVSENKIYILDRDEKGGKDIVRCLDFASGKEEWNFAYDAPGRYQHPGSRSVPSVTKDHIYTCGPNGDLYCVDKKTHKPVWNKGLKDAFGQAGRLMWGYGQNPLVYKDMLIVAPMTSKTGVAALDLLTGDIRWSSEPLPGNPSYVSPAVITIGGVKQIAAISAGERGGGDSGTILGFDPETGKKLWSYNGWQCQIPIPNVIEIGDGRLFISGGYNAGAAMIKVEKKDQSYTVTEVFKSKDFNTHTHPPLLYKNHFYGQCTTNERHDGLVCMDLDGKLKWKTESAPVFDKGGMILADGLIFAVDGRDGFLYLIDPSPEAFKPIAKAQLLEKGESWAPLALVDGKLLIRDQKQMKCVQVR